MAPVRYQGPVRLYPAVPRLTAELAVLVAAAVLALLVDAAVAGPPLRAGVLNALWPPLVFTGVVAVGVNAGAPPADLLPRLVAPPAGARVDRSVRAAAPAPQWWLLPPIGVALALAFDGSAAGFAAAAAACVVTAARRRRAFRAWEREHGVEVVEADGLLYAAPLASAR